MSQGKSVLDMSSDARASFLDSMFDNAPIEAEAPQPSTVAPALMIQPEPAPDPMPEAANVQPKEGDVGLRPIFSKEDEKNEEKYVVNDIRMHSVRGGIIEEDFLERRRLMDGLAKFISARGFDEYDVDVITIINDATQSRMRTLVESLCGLAAMRTDHRSSYSTKTRDTRDNPRRLMNDGEEAMGPGALPPTPRAKRPAAAPKGVRAQAASSNLGNVFLGKTLGAAKSKKRQRDEEMGIGGGDGPGDGGLLPATTVKHADRRIGMRDAAIVLLRDMTNVPIRRNLIVKALSRVDTIDGSGTAVDMDDDDSDQ